MVEGLGAVMGGVFVGAVGAEIIRRKFPEVLDRLYTKTRQVTSAAKEAFKRGYNGVTQSPDPVRPKEDNHPKDAEG